MLLLIVFLRWFPCHGNWFSLQRDSHTHQKRNQTPAFVLFDALQVDKRANGEGWRGGGGWYRKKGEAGASQIFGLGYLLSSSQAEREREEPVQGRGKYRGKVIVFLNRGRLLTTAAVRVDREDKERTGSHASRRAFSHLDTLQQTDARPTERRRT